MIIDFLSLNLVHILLCTVLINIFYLNDKKVYLILSFDILINGIPFTTILIILLYYLNNLIFKFMNNTFLNRFILIIIYYFLFNITLYSIFNTFNYYIITYTLNNLIYNVLFYYFSLKYLQDKYNLVGDDNG